jgi:hypothetical protein
MFMQSFENSSKQQQRRNERYAAMQRMQKAAQMDVDSISDLPSESTSTPVPAADGEEAKHDPREKKSGVSQMLRDIVSPTTAFEVSTNFDARKSTTSTGLRFSTMKETAQAFMWDDGSAVSGMSGFSGAFMTV